MIFILILLSSFGFIMVKHHLLNLYKTLGRLKYKYFPFVILSLICDTRVYPHFIV